MATNPAAESATSASPGNEPRLINEASVMRAMAHPARMTILEHLGSDGPSTATECAELVGLSPSATSYHLRALARAGLIEEAPGRGDARERVWRSTVAAGGYTVMADRDAAPDVKAAENELIESFLSWENIRVRQYLARRAEEPAEWWDQAAFREIAMILTADELREVTDAVFDLLTKYRKRDRPDPPPGSRSVSAVFRTFPTDKP
ncbi:ArsR/SmtB family transcription factor [Rugosimonospora africana]|nr:metalloregulator ArsR/SmtB family transcription factor [Rugosimonospora africana]